MTSMTDDEIKSALASWSPVLKKVVEGSACRDRIFNDEEKAHLYGLFEELMLMQPSAGGKSVAERMVDFLEDKLRLPRVYAALISRQNASMSLYFVRLLKTCNTIVGPDNIVRAAVIASYWNLIDLVIDYQGSEKLN